MRNLKTIYSQTKEMLNCFGQKNIHCHFTLFLNKKTGIQERRELRQKLIEQIKNHKDFQKAEKGFNWDNLLKLGTKADCPFASVSISHCNYLGAFLFTFDKRLSIGFDIEQKKRITKKIIARISSKEERDQAPNNALLWVAKEAGFKCLSDNKAQLLLSDCLISNWKKEKTKEIYFFNSYSKTNNKKALGLARFIDDLALAYTETRSELE